MGTPCPHQSMTTTREEMIRNAARCIIALKEEGRLEEAENLENMVKESMAGVQEEPEQDTAEVIRRMNDMDTTSTMIGEHLAAGVLKQGKPNLEELREAAPFIEKCIPMLEMQVKLVGSTFTKLPKEEQIKHAKTIENATKTLQLLTSLKQLNAAADVAQC